LSRLAETALHDVGEDARRDHHKQRNRIRCFNKLKHFRPFAMGYDCPALNVDSA